MAEAETNDFKVIYDGKDWSQTTKFLVTGLKTGQQYSFRLKAVNHNTKLEDIENNLSVPFIYYSCVAPS